MKLALIQEKQNDLYQFHSDALRFSRDDALRLQKKMMEQNLVLLSQTVERGVDIAVTSEAVNFPGQPFKLFVPPRTLVAETQRELLDGFSAAAKLGSMYVVGGMFTLEMDGNLYNSAVVFDRDGKEVFRYHKNFLAGDENDYLTPGHGFPVWESEFGKIGIAICWDMQFPEVARAYACQDADIIFCPTWGWEHIYGAARAYENGIYVASAMAVPAWKNIEGKRAPSQLVAPDGTVLAQGSAEGPAVIFGEIAAPADCKPFRDLRINSLTRWQTQNGSPNKKKKQ